ncbi:probable RNA polymerase II nuclear localization protein SLC7A6OS [Melitaea cinxia]|uniref:probable RNA polymerase II nuclear localization protein SLC7A6OS n=1 Tax=Melitaea cinxia TaxID=113334 RepID=UPI001E272E6A|nr:probable RNA polymerase II nuclear localization protein SLC7A6OS [Melitaea cinxia]
MSTSTFLRVKRRQEDNPQDALALTLCKRQKTDAEEISPSLPVLREEKKDSENGQNTNDLKTSAKEDSHISMLDNLVSIENYETELIDGSARDNGLTESDVEDCDDSNVENYWKNDYADFDISNIGKDDNIEDDVSSDIDEDIYDETMKFSDEGIRLYGTAYIKYKARFLTERPDVIDLNNNVL